MFPHQRERYPDHWEDLSKAYREKTGWACEQCGIAHSMTRISRLHEKPYKVNIQVAHLNHDPSDCREENLKSLCQDCHLRYDGLDNGRKSRRTHYQRKHESEIRAGQLTLFVDELLMEVSA